MISGLTLRPHHPATGPRRRRSIRLALLLTGLLVGSSLWWSGASTLASSVSGVTVRLTTPAAGASGVDYRVYFTLTSTLPKNGSITVTAPVGTSFASLQSSEVLDLPAAQNISVCCQAVSNGDRTINMPVSGAPTGERLEVLLADVANPTAPSSTEHLTVFTSADHTPATSTAYAVIPAKHISTPTVTLTSPASRASGVDYRVTFDLSSTGALTGTQDSITVTAPSGTSFASSRGQVIDKIDGRDVTVCCQNVSSNGLTITTAVKGAQAGDQVTLILHDVQNPSVLASTDRLKVSTSSDYTPVSSGTYAILSAHKITSPVVSLTTAAAGATGVDYRLTFNLSTTGALSGTQDTITVTAPPGTSFGGAQGQVLDDTRDATDITFCCQSIGNGNSTINVGLGGAAAGDQLTVILHDVTNPSGPATGKRLMVSTSSDYTPVSSSSYAIVAAHRVSKPVVKLSKSTPDASGVDYSITFTASATGALNGSGDSITVTAPAGTSFNSLSSDQVFDESADDLNVATCCNAITAGGSTIRIPVQGALAGDTIQVVLHGVVNPPAPLASKTLSVVTTSDPLTAVSGSYAA
ncbi:MAG TPA: hypothetical protein VFB34_02130 [Chloroflexota bacterium]|nr:hypothetical protein [Chloroflexota bacterium]